MKKSLRKAVGAILAAVLAAGTAVQPYAAEAAAEKTGIIEVYADQITANAAGKKETAYVEWQ